MKNLILNLIILATKKQKNIEFLSDKFFVKSFAIHFDNIKKPALIKIVNFIKDRDDVEKLILFEVSGYTCQNNNFESLEFMNKILKKVSTLIRLKVQSNHIRIGMNVSKIIAQNLPHNLYLKKLDLSGIKIGDEGLKLI